METVSVDITRAKAITGWMSELELVWLAERAIEHSVIVEIGSYLGRSTRAMLDHTQGIVYAFDDWKGPREVYMSKEDRAGLFYKFLINVDYWWWSENHKLLVEGDNYKKLRTTEGELSVIYATCKTAITLFPDMVFLDGSHEYEDVKRDILFWKDKISKGGLLCGHDVGVFDGVSKAVTELLGDVEVVPNTSIWWKVI